MNFLTASLTFAKLEYRTFKYYPTSFALSVVQSFVNMSIWLFVSLFLKDYAASSLSGYNGDFVAYMVIGVVFYQNAGKILTLPFQSLSKAFWDKRLEIYNTANYGIWAYITGRAMWVFGYNLIIQLGVLLFAVFVIGVQLNSQISIATAVLFYLLFIITNFGIGLMGASSFFSLEVKQGREPITWITDILARLFSGVYYPIAVLPASLKFISYIVPHTYGLKGIRLIMMNGYNLGNLEVFNAFIAMVIFSVATLTIGIFMFNRSLEKAQRGNGIGIVV